MAKKKWLFSTQDGSEHTIRLLLSDSKVEVDGSKQKPAKDQKSNEVESVYNLTLSNGEAVTLFKNFFHNTVTYQGKDVDSGETYDVTRMSEFRVLLSALYITIYAILGGVGCLLASYFSIYLTFYVMYYSKFSKTMKIVINIGIFLLFAVLSVVFGVFIQYIFTEW
ncbi:MAG: hypothetical protein K6C69_08460 [Lachnospiraceae bacterium]|nr:hypothetical protein [Lachnospiraceae bacterium]